MKCREQEKTANAPLRRPNGLRHQQHFIKQRRRLARGGGANTDRCTPLCCCCARKDCRMFIKTSAHDGRETNHPRARPSCVSGYIAATPSWEIVTTFPTFQGLFFVFSKSLILLMFSLETHIKHPSSSQSSNLCPALFPSPARRIRRCSHLQMDEESLQGGRNLRGFP